MQYYHSNYGKRGRKNRSKLHKFVIYILLLLIITAFAVGMLLYKIIFEPNVWVKNEESKAIFIPTGSTFENVKSILYSDGVIIHRNNFEWLAKRKKYNENIKAGKFRLINNMNNDELINLLRSGNQEPVNLIFNNIRNVEQLAQRVSEQIETDSASIARLLLDSLFISKYGLTNYTVSTIFIPNTYQVFWTETAEEFIDRMYREYKSFWNENRRSKAESMELTIPEVITLASIVEKESTKNDEKPLLAGVYVNRLSRGWLLQADPTLVFALGDFDIKRVLNVHKSIESPYNTYLHGGLPPGPICIPSIASIDAVLGYSKHNYFYFCAKDDMSGYHSFSNSLRQHNRNAAKFQEALNRMRIFK